MKVFQTTILVAIAALAVLTCVDANAAHMVVTYLAGDPSLMFAAVAAGAVDPEVIKTELDRISTEVKQFGEKALAEAKRNGDLSVETKAKVDEMLGTQGELKARLQAAEQKLDRRGGEQRDERPKSMGQQFVESDGFKALAGQSNGKINISAAITSSTTSGGDAVGPDRQVGFVIPPTRRLTVRDLLTPGRTDSNVIQYVKETGFTNNAAPVSETVRKPESTLVYDLLNAPVVTIAHFIKAAKQILDDAKGLQSQIDGRLTYGLKLVEEGQLLKGSGTGQNLNGIYTQATAYSAPITIASPTRLDVLRLALLQVELAEYDADGIVLHPSDWAAIELQKDSTGAYIFANPQTAASPRLWGRSVVSTQAMTVDTFLVGAFKMAAQIFDREDANTVIATQNEDDFVKNMITIRTEERLALAVYRPEAFVKGDITPP